MGTTNHLPLEAVSAGINDSKQAFGAMAAMKATADGLAWGAPYAHHRLIAEGLIRNLHAKVARSQAHPCLGQLHIPSTNHVGSCKYPG